ncbi:hypothetical protein [Paracoccus shanxieyensis]|uniref:Uncharacterized protein n=1 Tax=Paracoccus shanxieyensis TaxID=2675752 RepID=A0A6L6J4C9_9RHOB|nr:hypothetical protein [Paracoccus shanxieyensis]MTH66718.1 hypothetical protein [Paracoccus shanxieyensis]MTH89957.1 hypothetical protein [Paracoccus shanxieyensis]
MTADMRQQLEACAAAGMLMAEAARHLGCSKEKVRYWARNLGIQFPEYVLSAPVQPRERDDSKRAVICGSRYASDYSSDRVSLPRMPWDDAEGTLAARPETDPPRGIMSTVPGTLRADMALAAIRAAHAAHRSGEDA